MRSRNNFVFSFNPAGASISRTDEFTNELNTIIEKDPNVKDIITIGGYDLTSSSQRTHAAATIINLILGMKDQILINKLMQY